MRRYATIIVGILVALVCARLGVWQLDRLAQRKSGNAILRAQLAAPAVSFDTIAVWGGPSARETLRYRRAAATGTFDFEHEVVVMARVHQGVPGVHVVTPLKITERLAVLVERGWVPAPDGRRPAVDATEAGKVVLVTGVLVPSSERPESQHEGAEWPRYVAGLNVAELSAAYPYTLVPVILRRTALPPNAPTGMRAIPLQPITNGPHLSYAVQWFAFATIALVGSFVLLLRQRSGDVTAS